VSPSDGGTAMAGVDQPPVDLAVGGRVGLGTTAGARVRIFQIVGGKFNLQSLIGESTTDEKGLFQLKVPRKFAGEPVLIQADLSAAKVKCVVISGCDQALAFGVEIPQNLHKITLSLMVQELSDTDDYQLGFLSHIASESAFAQAGGVGAISQSADKLENQAQIAKNNSQVASRFNVVADLPTAEMIDITSPEQLVIAKAPALFNTVVESALAAECLKYSSTSSMADAVDFCVTQYIDRGIADLSANPDEEVTGLGLLSAMVEIYAAIAITSGRDLSLESSDVSALCGVALSSAPGHYERGIASDNASGSLLDKGMDLIADIRQIAASIDLNKLVAISSLAAFVNGDASISLKDFGVVVEQTDLFEGTGFTQSSYVLQQVGLAVLDVLADYYRDGVVREKAVALTHSFSQEMHLIRVLDEIDACPSSADFCPVAVDLKLGIKVASYSTNQNLDFLELTDLYASVEGDLVMDGYALHFSPVAKNLEARNFRVRFDKLNNENIVSVDVERARGEFELLIESGLERFSGQISASLTELSVLKRSLRIVEPSGIDVTRETQFTRVQLFNLLAFNANASGRVTGKLGSEFFASLNVTQPSAGYSDGLFEYIETEQFDCVTGSACSKISGESLLTGETTDSFLGLIASIAYKAELKGLPEPVLMRFSGFRKSAVETEISSLKMTYPGHALNLSGKFNKTGGITAMTASSLDGIDMFIESQVNAKRYGALTGPVGEDIASLVDMGEWIKVTFGDGHFESL
jgi:hypothetical protein